MGTTPVPKRWLQPTTRSAVQVTWHNEDDRVILSLWRDDACVASAPLTIEQTASLASFLVSHLGERAGEVSHTTPPLRVVTPED
jgi:hypothetical protein